MNIAEWTDEIARMTPRQKEAVNFAIQSGGSKVVLHTYLILSDRYDAPCPETQLDSLYPAGTRVSV